MKVQALILIQRELDLLKKYLQENVLTDFNKKKLSIEVATAKVVDEVSLPEDVISINSVVHVEECQNKKSFIFQIVPPANANVKKNKVSVLAPISVALLGYRMGSTIQWEMPGGIQEFEVLKVSRV